jgi:hypothetical protein
VQNLASFNNSLQDFLKTTSPICDTILRTRSIPNAVHTRSLRLTITGCSPGLATSSKGSFQLGSMLLIDHLAPCSDSRDNTGRRHPHPSNGVVRPGDNRGVCRNIRLQKLGPKLSRPRAALPMVAGRNECQTFAGFIVAGLIGSTDCDPASSIFKFGSSTIVPESGKSNYETFLPMG